MTDPNAFNRIIMSTVMFFRVRAVVVHGIPQKISGRYPSLKRSDQRRIKCRSLNLAHVTSFMLIGAGINTPLRLWLIMTPKQLSQLKSILNIA
jgi:hypothetical protein